MRSTKCSADPQVKHIGVATDMQTPDRGTLQVVRQPVSLSRTPSTVVMRYAPNAASIPMRCWRSSSLPDPQQGAGQLFGSGYILLPPCAMDDQRTAKVLPCQSAEDLRGARLPSRDRARTLRLPGRPSRQKSAFPHTTPQARRQFSCARTSGQSTQKRLRGCVRTISAARNGCAASATASKARGFCQRPPARGHARKKRLTVEGFLHDTKRPANPRGSRRQLATVDFGNGNNAQAAVCDKTLRGGSEILHHQRAFFNWDMVRNPRANDTVPRAQGEWRRQDPVALHHEQIRHRRRDQGALRVADHRFVEALPARLVEGLYIRPVVRFPVAQHSRHRRTRNSKRQSPSPSSPAVGNSAASKSAKTLGEAAGATACRRRPSHRSGSRPVFPGSSGKAGIGGIANSAAALPLSQPAEVLVPKQQPFLEYGNRLEEAHAVAKSPDP